MARNRIGPVTTIIYANSTEAYQMELSSGICAQCLGYGITDFNEGVYADGIQLHVVDRTCSRCGGTGIKTDN